MIQVWTDTGGRTGHGRKRACPYWYYTAEIAKKQAETPKKTVFHRKKRVPRYFPTGYASDGPVRKPNRNGMGKWRKNHVPAHTRKFQLKHLILTETWEKEQLFVDSPRNPPRNAPRNALPDPTRNPLRDPHGNPTRNLFPDPPPDRPGNPSSDIPRNPSPDMPPDTPFSVSLALPHFPRFRPLLI